MLYYKKHNNCLYIGPKYSIEVLFNTTDGEANEEMADQYFEGRQTWEYYMGGRCGVYA